MKALWLVVFLVLGSVFLNEAFPKGGRTSSSGGSRGSSHSSSHSFGRSPSHSYSSSHASTSHTSSGSSRPWFNSMFSSGSSGARPVSSSISAKPSAPLHSSVQSRPSHSYPSSSGSSGFGSITSSHAYPQSSGFSGSSNSRVHSPITSSHSYPQNSGLSGTSGTSSHGYPMSSGLSGSSNSRVHTPITSGHSYPQNSGLSGATHNTGTSHGYPQSTGLSGTGHAYPHGTGLSGTSSGGSFVSHQNPPPAFGSGNTGFGSSHGSPGFGNFGHNPAATGIGHTTFQNSQSGMYRPGYTVHNTPTNNHFNHPPPPPGYTPVHSTFAQPVHVMHHSPVVHHFQPHYTPHYYQPSYAMPYQRSSSSDDLLKGLMIWNLARSATHSGHHYGGHNYNNYDNPGYRNNYETHNTHITHITQTTNTGSVDKNSAPVNMANCTLTINADTDPQLYTIPCDMVSTFSPDFNTTNTTKYDKLTTKDDKSCKLTFIRNDRVRTKYFPCDVLMKASMDEPVVGKLNCTQDPRKFTQEMNYTPCTMIDNAPLPDEFQVIPKERSGFLLFNKTDEVTTVLPIINETTTFKVATSDDSSTVWPSFDVTTAKAGQNGTNEDGLGVVPIHSASSDASTTKSPASVESVSGVAAFETTTNRNLEVGSSTESLSNYEQWLLLQNN